MGAADGAATTAVFFLNAPHRSNILYIHTVSKSQSMRVASSLLSRSPSHHDRGIHGEALAELRGRPLRTAPKDGDCVDEPRERAPAGDERQDGPVPGTMQELRRHALMSRQVETGLIFMEMLGLDDACAYWRTAGIPEAIIDRLVNGHPGRAAASAEALEQARPKVPVDQRVSLFYCSSGRRQDLIGAAVVQAAIAIHQELGRDRAERMLRREGFDDDVVKRVLARTGSDRRRS